MEQEGYRLNEYAKLILEELGDIYVREHGNEIYVSTTFDFNPYYSASGEYNMIDWKNLSWPVGINCFL